MRKILSVLGVFVLLIFTNRCNEVTGPDKTPTSTAAPVVTSVEQGPYDEGTWLIHGRNFEPNPIATLESGGSAIPLIIKLSYPNGTLIRVLGSLPTQPGTYAPCVMTTHHKGCGNFLVTAN